MSIQIIPIELGNINTIEGPFSLCLGFFDGVHKGHQELVFQAKKAQEPVAVLTFDQSPTKLTNKSKGEGILTTVSERAQLFEDYGASYLFVIPFDQALMNLTPDQFITEVLNELNPKIIVCGYDYRFGKMAAGKAHDLKTSPLAKFATIIVEKIEDQAAHKVSTSKIKEELRAGEIDEVTENLNRYYTISGVVEKGYQNGKKIGFPTANIRLNAAYVLPKKGVYLTYIIVGGVVYLSMTNVGTHPTINEVPFPIVEVHIFDFDEDIYDQEVTVYFAHFIREEEKFVSLTQLIEKMKEDEIICRQLKAAYPFRSSVSI